MPPFHGSVHNAYMGKNVTTRFKTRRKNYIREWRKDRNLSLEALAERVGEKIGGFTHASLSRIERGLQPWSEDVLEAIADALRTDVASLLMRNPSDPEGMWSIWDRAQKVERELIVEMAETIIRRRSR
jgi:transcriptional regulator with XRE-family HTH domain